VNSTQPSDARPITTLTVRACCVILHDGQVALIHRQRPGGGQYSLPGGLVHADEEVTVALARELNEELGFDVTALPHRPELRWVQDQITTRPGTVTRHESYRPGAGLPRPGEPGRGHCLAGRREMSPNAVAAVLLQLEGESKPNMKRE